MFRVLLAIMFAVAAANTLEDPGANQLPAFKTQAKQTVGTMTSDGGALIDYDTATSSLNKEALSNQHLMEMLMHFDREIIPERTGHAQGTGAFGYFETTHDISHICKAALFNKVGKKTPVGCRFSTGSVSRGATEFVRETRGFACKFYTEEGNYDFVGINSPYFSIKDPLLVASLVHAQKRNPATNLPDPNAVFDLISYQPEMMFRTLYSLSDYGMPDGYKCMSGHGVHTFELINESGTKSFCRIHMLPCAGIKTLNSTQIKTLSSSDPNYFTRDLYNSIAKGDYPSWEMKMQCLTAEDVKKADFDIFDVTKYLPTKKYPLISVGKLFLNRNFLNYFAEIEQMAFCPGNLVPGILGSPDKLYEARAFSYRDTQNYRLGVNFEKIPVNCPLHPPLTYNRDGAAPVGNNGKNMPWYFPNSFYGPKPRKENNRPPLSIIFEKKPNNFKQMRDFYQDELSLKQKITLIENLAEKLSACQKFIQIKIIKLLTEIHSDLGNKVAKYIGVQVEKNRENN